MKTSFKTLSLISFIPILLLIFPLHLQADEEASAQTKDIQIRVGEWNKRQVIKVSIEDIKERILKGEPVRFVEEQEEEKRKIKAEWITNALKKEYGVDKIDIRNAIITGVLDFHIKDNLVNIDESGIEVDEIKKLKGHGIENVYLVSSSINIESCQIQSDFEAGYVDNIKFIIIFERSVAFLHSRFLKKVRFDSASFNDWAYFRSASFNGDTHFVSASFKQKVSFGSASFSGGAYFKSASFNGETHFSDASFNEKADFGSVSFNGGVDFDDASFNGEVDFDSASFNVEAFFESANFNDKAHFNDASFSVEAYFWGASFNGDTYFSDASFNEQADFGSASFNGDAHFDSAGFKEEADFGSVSFNGEADFDSASFNVEADFSDASFKEKASFGSVSFNGEVDFESATFDGNADFYSAKFKEEVLFSGANFTTSIDLSRAKYSKMRISWLQLKGLLDRELYGGDGKEKGLMNVLEGLQKDGIVEKAIKSLLETNISIERLKVDTVISWGEVYLNLVKNFEDIGDKKSANDCYYHYRYYKPKFKKLRLGEKTEKLDKLHIKSKFPEQIKIKYNQTDTKTRLNISHPTLVLPDLKGKKIKYDKDAKVLVLRGVMSKEERNQLLNLSENSKFKMAIERLYKNSQGNSKLIFKGVMTKKEKYSLLQLSEDKTYKEAIEKLYIKSQFLPEYIVRYGFLEKTKWLGEYILFGLTCGYGVYPFRTLGVVVVLIMFFTMFYLTGCLLFPNKKYLVSQQERKSLSNDNRLHYKLYNCFYFSVMTFTTVGYGDLHPKGGFKVAAMIEGFLGWMTMALFLVTLGNVWLR